MLWPKSGCLLLTWRRFSHSLWPRERGVWEQVSPRLSCHDTAGTSLTDTLTLPRGFMGLRVEWRIRALVAHSKQWVCGSVCQYISESVGFYFSESRPSICFLLARAMQLLPCVKVYTPTHMLTLTCPHANGLKPLHVHDTFSSPPCCSPNINKRCFYCWDIRWKARAALFFGPHYYNVLSIRSSGIFPFTLKCSTFQRLLWYRCHHWLMQLQKSFLWLTGEEKEPVC